MSGFSLKKIAVNAISIGGGEVANKACTFLVYAAVSRFLTDDLEAFGQLAIGLTLLYTCHVFGYAGLPTILIRLVARHPRTARRHLVHGYAATAFTSCLAAIVMIAVAFAMQYQTATTQVICLLALAVPFYSLTMIAEAIIKGRDKMHLIAVGNLPGNAAMVLGSLLVLWLGYGVHAVALVVVVSRLLTFLVLHNLTSVALTDVPHSRFRFALSMGLLSRAKIFLGSDGIAAIGASLFGLLLSKVGEKEVAMLSAGFQLLQPIQIMYRSVGHSTFPPLVAAAKSSKSAVVNLVHSVLSLLIRIAFPACLVMFVFAGDILDLVYGSKGFREGAFVLQIVAFSLLFDPLNPVLGHGLWAVGADRDMFRIVIINTAFNLLLGLVLISQFGLAGAAVCALVSSVVNTAQHYRMFQQKVGNPRLLFDALRMLPAVLLSLGLVVFLPWSRFVSLPIAVMLYAIVVLPMTPTATGLFNPRIKKLPS